jgi:hypothetical protein
MQREGGVVAAQFQQGQVFEQPVQLAPNKCYTVVAVGVGIQELDIALVATTPIPNTSPVLARDSGNGAQTSLGGRGNCFRWQMPFPLQAKVVYTATTGAGIAAGQLYSK